MNHRFLAFWLIAIFMLPAMAEEPKMDVYGDPLPIGAIQRLGTIRFRSNSFIYCMAYSPDGKLIATGDGSGVILWDTATGRKVHELLMNITGGTQIDSVAFSPDSKLITFLNIDHDKAQIRDVASGKLVREFELNKDARTSSVVPKGNEIGFSCDGLKIGVLGQKTFVLYDANTGTALFTIVLDEKDQKASTALAMSPKEKIVAIGDRRGGVTFYDLDNGKKVREVRPEGNRLGNQICSLSFSEDGSTIAGGTFEKICIWKTRPLSW